MKRPYTQLANRLAILMADWERQDTELDDAFANTNYEDCPLNTGAMLNRIADRRETTIRQVVFDMAPELGIKEAS